MYSLEELMRKTVILRQPIDTHYFKVRDNPFHRLWRNASSHGQSKYVSPPEAVTHGSELISDEVNFLIQTEIVTHTPVLISDENNSGTVIHSPELTNDEDESLPLPETVTQSPVLISDEENSLSQSDESETPESTSITEQSSIDDIVLVDEEPAPKYSLREKRHLITRENILNFSAFLDEQSQFRPKRAKILKDVVSQIQKQQQFNEQKQHQQKLKKQRQKQHQQELLKKKQHQQELLKKKQHQQELLKKKQHQQELLKEKQQQQQHQQDLFKKQQQIEHQQKQQKQKQLEIFKKQQQIEHQQKQQKQKQLELFKEQQAKVTFYNSRPHDQIPKWTYKETMLLVLGVRNYGKNWTKIHTVYNLSANRSTQSMIGKYGSLVRNGEHTRMIQAFEERARVDNIFPKENSSLTQTKSLRLTTKRISLSPALQQELPIATPIQNLNFEDASSFEQSPESEPRRKSNRLSKSFYKDKQDPYFIQ